MTTEHKLQCSNCSTVMQIKGKTHCWSNDPQSKAPRYCPEGQRQIIENSFAQYQNKKGGEEESSDAKIARVAARVEGLCYQKIPGSSAMNARWTRVEDTIAFAS